MNLGDSQEFFACAFAQSSAMVILRGFNVERSQALCAKAWAGGVDLVEIPLQGDESRRALEAVIQGSGGTKSIGAGTIVSVELVEQAFAAQAAFTVAPGLDFEVLQRSLELGMPHLPGVSTPSEVQAAARLGLTWLKAFPASALGTEWFKAMGGPFPKVRFVATGGVTGDNAASFLLAGASAVSLGSSFAELSTSNLREIVRSTPASFPAAKCG